MNIQSILATKGSQVITIPIHASVREAVAALVAHNIGSLVVVNDTDQPVGIVSERDIIREAARNDAVLSLGVGTIMTREVITGSPQDDLGAVAHTMTENRIRHIPVVENDKLVGMISIGDIVKAQRDQYEGEVYTLQAQILEAPAQN